MLLTLPIHETRDELLRILRAGNRLLLTAPPGSGKTTQVPQILLEAKAAGGQIVVLQPRRLATRMVARRVAEEMSVRVGDLVGYQTRHDSQVSAATQVRFVTEGLFLRQIQHNPRLPGVGTVILDEFHERSLAADTALALVRRVQETHRPDLRLLVMSATLDTQRVGEYLRCPSLGAQGRAFPVDVRYLEKRSQAPAWDLAADALADIVASGEPGDVLVFMPGAYEIRRTIESCRRVAPGEAIDFLPLHGELPVAQQDAALRPGANRKVIVSTNVAETSITIEGIRHVVDSGLARINRFDPRRGINVLLVEGVSQSSSTQRAGRAGRTAPGTCRRLWSELDQRARPPHDTPEILRLDLTEVVLQLKALGVNDPRDFDWLDAPAPAAVERAIRTLEGVDAVAPAGELTPAGRTMASFPMHPRLSRMLVEAGRRNCLERAALWAALVSERDIFIRGAKPDASEQSGSHRSDLLVLEHAFERAVAANFDIGRCSALGVHANACREVEKTRKLYLEVCEDAGLKPKRGGKDSGDTDDLILCLITAYPDHIALRRSSDNPSCALTAGRRGQIEPASVAQRPGLLLAVEIREVGAGQAIKTVLSIASEIEPEWLEQVHPRLMTRRFVTQWNAQKLAVERVEQRLFDDLVFEQTARPETDLDAAAEVLADQIVRGEIKLDTWDEQVEQWIARTRCVADWFPERRLLRYEPDDLRVILQEICAGATRFGQVQDRPCLPKVRDALSWDDQQFVEKMAPDRIELPRGWKMKVEYQPGSPPRGRAKIQDFYGLDRSPMVAGGRQKVTLEILGPNYRPVQMTDDLAGFWANLYPVLKKELSRKYPRHEWR
ncbi:MAG: ATP-dependent helicase HrpB [Planctomycetota bacterium]|nr:ATP-dependent helicase HrpB [Planctomycetota bacterium]